MIILSTIDNGRFLSKLLFTYFSYCLLWPWVKLHPLWTYIVYIFIITFSRHGLHIHNLSEKRIKKLTTPYGRNCNTIITFLSSLCSWSIFVFILVLFCIVLVVVFLWRIWGILFTSILFSFVTCSHVLEESSIYGTVHIKNVSLCASEGLLIHPPGNQKPSYLFVKLRMFQFVPRVPVNSSHF